VDDLDYTFKFDDFSSSQSVVEMIDHRSVSRRNFWVQIEDEQLARGSQSQIPPYLADLIDIGVAIYLADRMSVHRGEMQCGIHIAMSLRQPELANSRTLEALSDILYWYSQDHWSFEFRRRSKSGRPSESQLPLREKECPNALREVALWSGGLDSLAGLLNRIAMQPHSSHLLFGTGDNFLIQSIQREVAKSIRQQLGDQVRLVQLKWNTETLTRTRRNTTARMRGFTFMLLGAVSAILHGQNSLFVYENGIGAINLPYQPSETGIDHSRSVHPLSLLRMSDLVSLWLHRPFDFQNPFLSWTKAQMCEIFKKSDYRLLIAGTISCDSRRRETNSPTQCGFCSSCLLRRQALASNNIADPTRYMITTATTQGRNLSPNASSHLRAMLQQVVTLRSLLSNSNSALEFLAGFQELSEIVDMPSKKQGQDVVNMPEQLLMLYKSYAGEWERVWRFISSDLLDDEDMNSFESKMDTHEREQ